MFADGIKWYQVQENKNLKIYAICSILILIITLLLTGQFLKWVESREGATLNDPLLSLFSPVDVSVFTFIFIYGSIIIGIISLSFKPRMLFLACNTYTIMLIFRLITMYLTPLNPPEKIIYLDDPFVEFFSFTDITSKDLFFSGHTSTIFILYLTAVNKKLKVFFIISGIIVIFLILLQHAHYTIDIIAAFPFTYIAWKLGRKIDFLLIEKNFLKISQ